MTFRVGAWAMIASLAIGTSATGQAPKVTLFVTVIAPATGPLKNLTEKDFAITGGKAGVTTAVLAAQPLSIELLVDISHPSLGPTPAVDDLRSALEGFVHTIRGADPTAQIALVQVGAAARVVVSFDAPAEALDDAVATIGPGPETSAVLIEAFDNAGQALAQEPPPRRAIVSIDFATPDPIPNTAVNPMARDVYQSGASVWAVSVRGTVRQPLIRENTLNMIVKNNGGDRTTIVQSTGLSDQLQSIANSLLSQYVLTISGTDLQHVQQLSISTTAGVKVVPSIFARSAVEQAEKRVSAGQPRRAELTAAR